MPITDEKFDTEYNKILNIVTDSGYEKEDVYKLLRQHRQHIRKVSTWKLNTQELELSLQFVIHLKIVEKVQYTVN